MDGRHPAPAPGTGSGLQVGSSAARPSMVDTLIRRDRRNMTTLANRPNPALLVIDVQNGNTAEAYNRDNVVANIRTLIDKARAAGVDVVWVQHNNEGLPRGSQSWEYVPELVRRDSEPLVHKSYADSFEDTELEAVLSERGIGRLIVAGAQTDECIRATLHGAITRGYDATLVGD